MRRSKTFIAVLVCVLMVFSNVGYAFAGDADPVSVPEAPVAELITSDTIVLKEIEGYEYSRGGIEWQPDGKFTGLKPNTNYVFYQRLAATETGEAGEISSGKSFRTLKLETEAPAMPEISSVSDKEIWLVRKSGYQYSKDGISWSNSPGFTNLEPDTAYVFYQRIAETSTNYASPASEGLLIKTKKVGAESEIPVVEKCTVTSIEVAAVTGSEYSLDGETWQEETAFYDLEPMTKYTVYQRVKATETHVAGAPSSISVTTPKAAAVPEGYIGIYTAADLNAVRDDLAGKYILMNDIAFSEADFQTGGAYYNDGAFWLPIGTKSHPFSGRFNGNGYTVSGLKIYGHDVNQSVYGIFGYSTGNIRNLGMAETDITVAVEHDSADVPNVYAGAVVGYNAGSVSGCYATGSMDVFVDGTYIEPFVGGIAGFNNGTIGQCYSAVYIMADGNSVAIGGITSNGGTVIECYNAGRLNVKPNTYTSVNLIGNASTIADCYSIEQKWDENYSVSFRQSDCALTHEQMMNPDNFAGFDFENTWVMHSENGYLYPQLKGVAHKAAVGNTAEFAGGTGTVIDPYIIKTKRHLENVENHLGAYYRMEADIVFTSSDFAEKTWTPLGSTSLNGFWGYFDGNGHVIKNIKVKAEHNASITVGGIFEKNMGIIENLGTVGGSVDVTISEGSEDSRTEFYAGGIVGKNRGVIRNCYNDNDVSIIEPAKNNVNVSVHATAGGIAATSSQSLVKNCYNSGTVYTESKGNAFVDTGGIVGKYGNLHNCYNSGQFIEYDNSTGEASGVMATTSGTVKNCYSIYYGKQNVGDQEHWYLTEDMMLQQSCYAGFDFENVWIMDPDAGYPFPELRSVPHVERDGNTSEFAEGAGKINDPYIIKTVEHLKNIEKYPNAYFELGCDVDLSDEIWSPIFMTESTPFKGFLNGKGYAIKGMHCESLTDSELYVGLFGYVDGKIRNINFEDYQINIDNAGTATVKAGVAAAHIGYNGVIESCKVKDGTISIKNETSYVRFGGIAGEVESGSIIRCSFHGQIVCQLGNTNSVYIGGLAGDNDGKISRSYNDGVIDADIESVYTKKVYMYFGGIAAQNNREIRDCYNAGQIKVNADSTSYIGTYIGGIAGSTVNYANYNKTPIINVYNIGTLQGENVSPQSIVGKGYSSAITNAYYQQQEGAESAYGTPIAGTDVYTGFDMETVWFLDETDTAFPYPQLRDFAYSGGYDKVHIADCTVEMDKIFIYTGSRIKPDVKVMYQGETLVKGVDYTVDYYNNIGVGTGTLKIWGKGKFTGVREESFEIQNGSFSDRDIYLEYTSTVYTGKSQEPEVSVSGLVEGKDYIVSYENNTEAGMATVYVVGIGNYGGLTALNFEIRKKDISSYKVYGLNSKYTYTGEAIEPEVFLQELTASCDYAVSYEHNLLIGQASVKITGIGSCTGEIVESFDIVKPSVGAVSNLKVNLYSKYNQVKITWSKASEVDGYAVYYKKSTAAKYTKLVSVKNSQKIVSSLGAGYKYNFKVVPYVKVGGTTFYGTGKIVSCSTLKKLKAPSVKKYSSKKVRVKWANIAGESGYQISRSTSASKTKVVATYKTTTGTSKIITAAKNKTYYYRVRAFKIVDGKYIYGPWSGTYKYKLR